MLGVLLWSLTPPVETCCRDTTWVKPVESHTWSHHQKLDPKRIIYLESLALRKNLFSCYWNRCFCAVSQGGWTALTWACYKGRVEVAKLLLEHGANPNTTGQVTHTSSDDMCYHTIQTRVNASLKIMKRYKCSVNSVSFSCFNLNECKFYFSTPTSS